MPTIGERGFSGLRRAVTCVVVLFLVAACATPAVDVGATQPLATSVAHWVTSWGTALQIPEPQNTVPAETLRRASLRQVVRLSLGGSVWRVRLSNAFGAMPLTIAASRVALAAAPGSGAIVSGSSRELRFDGAPAVTIPAGAEYVSDPIDWAVSAGTDVAVSLYVDEPAAPQTGHPGSRATSFVVPGLHVDDAEWPQATKVIRWLQIAAIEVRAVPGVHAVALAGDSITDGFGVQPETHLRWSDQLAARLRGSGRTMGVLNVGIGGGRLLRDGLGPNLVARFERDVLARPGVTHAVVMIGINDLGNQHRARPDDPPARAQLLRDMRTALTQIVGRAHERGVCMLAATLLPYLGSDYYQPSEANDEDRRSHNTWLRSSGVFDGVIDMEAALRDPARPNRMRPDLDIGDHLHPSAAGYRAMADAVPLEWLDRCPRQPALTTR